MDQKLLLLINRAWTSPLLDRVMAVFSSFDFWLPLLILGSMALLIWGGFRGRAFLLAALAGAALSDGAISNPLKHFVNRPRPVQAMGGVRQLDLAKVKPRLLGLWRPLVVRENAFPEAGERGRSFPSSHTTNTMAAAMVAALFFPRRGWLALFFAALVAYSRIYTGSHWPSDILASMLLGAGVGLLTVTGAEFAWRQATSRWWLEEFRRHPSLLAA